MLLLHQQTCPTRVCNMQQNTIPSVFSGPSSGWGFNIPSFLSLLFCTSSVKSQQSRQWTFKSLFYCQDTVQKPLSVLFLFLLSCLCLSQLLTTDFDDLFSSSPWPCYCPVPSRALIWGSFIVCILTMCSFYYDQVFIYGGRGLKLNSPPSCFAPLGFFAN